MEQTAIEWLMEEWPALKYQLPTWLVEQAKAMEKEQIIKAFSNGQELPISNPLLPHYSSEEYYNETYNK